MSDVDWDLVNRIADQALQLPADERLAFIESQELESSTAAEVLSLVGIDTSAEFELEPSSRRLGVLLNDGDEGDDALIGTVLADRFRIVSFIASGASGRVYRGERISDFEQTVAIKVFAPRVLTASGRANFLKEIQLLSEVSKHPDIATILDAGTTDSAEEYFVMEFVEGQDIVSVACGESFNESINRTITQERQSSAQQMQPRASPTPEDSGEVPRKANRSDDSSTVTVAESSAQPNHDTPFVPLRTRERLDLFRNACEPVCHAHRLNIVHSDLKPAHLIVGSDPTTGLRQIRLLDFGIARQCADDTDAPPRSTAYTPGFAAPEQREGGPLTPRCDVYSLGVVLYCMLSGKAPPDDGTPLTIPQSLPSEVRSIIGRATAASAEDRYRDATELLTDVVRYLDGFPVEAHSTAGVYRFRKLLARYPVSAIALVVAFVAMLAGTVVAYHGEQRALRSRRLALDSTHSLIDLAFIQPGSKTYEADADRVFDTLQKLEDDVVSSVEAGALATSELKAIATAWRNAAHAEFDNGQPRKALDRSERAIRSFQRWVEIDGSTESVYGLAGAYETLAVIAAESDGFERAITAYDQAIATYKKALSYDSDRVSQSIAMCQTQRTECQQKQKMAQPGVVALDQQFKTAIRLMDEYKWREAAAAFRATIPLHQHPDVKQNYGNVVTASIAEANRWATVCDLAPGGSLEEITSQPDRIAIPLLYLHVRYAADQNAPLVDVVPFARELQALADRTNDQMGLYYTACCYAVCRSLAESEANFDSKVLEYLQRAKQSGFQAIREIADDDSFDTFRAHPEFNKFVSKLKNP